MIDTIAERKNTNGTTKLSLPSTLEPLQRFAWNYWWSWSRDGAGCFRELAPMLWEECQHNPRLLLSRVSEYRMAEMSNDPVYCERVAKLAHDFDMYLAQPWANEVTSITAEHPVAYFCAEFGVHTSLPLYSGGLGILAGDHLKSASDLRLPLVAVG